MTSKSPMLNPTAVGSNTQLNSVSHKAGEKKLAGNSYKNKELGKKLYIKQEIILVLKSAVLWHDSLCF